jgi:hypothetical protein
VAVLDGLSKGVAGRTELADKVAGELTRLRSAEMSAELEAAKALTALQQKMVKDKPFDEANAKALAKLAEKHAGTKAGERAARLAKMAKLEVMR